MRRHTAAVSPPVVDASKTHLNPSTQSASTVQTKVRSSSGNGLGQPAKTAAKPRAANQDRARLRIIAAPPHEAERRRHKVAIAASQGP